MRAVMTMDEKFPKVSEVFSISNGIFAHCNYDFQVISKEELDRLFYTNYGLRSVAPIVSSIVLAPKATEADLTILGETLTSLCRYNWDRLKDMFIAEYDPLHNYFDEFSESIQDDNSKTSNVKSTDSTTYNSSESLNNTKTNNYTREESVNSTESEINNDTTSIYGFNSVGSNPSNSINGTDNNDYESTTNVTDSANQTNTGTKTNDSNSSRNLSSERKSEENGTRTRTSTHKGNIGNLTTQQLVKQEIELRRWNFIESILSDAKELLTIPLYL